MFTSLDARYRVPALSFYQSALSLGAMSGTASMAAVFALAGFSGTVIACTAVVTTSAITLWLSTSHFARRNS